jgi:hypothetical protein
MMDKAVALPTYPQGLARQFGPAQKQNVIIRILVALSGKGIHLICAANCPAI